MSFTLRMFKNNSCSTRIFVFLFLFSRFLILVQIKRIITCYTLHQSLLFLGRNSFILRLFQHVMSLIYEHVLFNQASCEYVNIVQEIINKGTNVNVKGEQKNKLHLINGIKQP